MKMPKVVKDTTKSISTSYTPKRVKLGDPGGVRKLVKKLVVSNNKSHGY
jgi:hypothetical protein